MEDMEDELFVLSFLSADYRNFFCGITKNKQDLHLALRYFLSICRAQNLTGVPLVGVHFYQDSKGNRQAKPFKVKIMHGCWINFVHCSENDPDFAKKELQVKNKLDESYLGLVFGYVYPRMARSGVALKHFDFENEFSIVCLTQRQEPKITINEEEPVPYEYVSEL